jgi:amino acid transporter
MEENQVTIVSVPADLFDRTTAAALEEKKKLQKHFGRFDMLFFLVCTLVGLDTIGTVANKGAQGFTWLLFLGVFFFFPYALLIAELGSAFPEEGGPYIWSRLAFGRLVAGVNAVLYWVSNPIWVGGTLCITAIAAFGDFFTPMNTFWQYVFALAFIWFTVVSAIVSFDKGKWIPTIGAWCRMLVLGFFTFSVIIYAIEHGVHGFGVSSFSPTYAIFIGVVPVLFFNYVGFELPNAAGDEMKDPQRDVPFTVVRSAIGTALLYGAPILAILLVLPTSAVTNLSGFLDAIKAVFTVYGGHVAASGTATLTGFGQALGYLTSLAFILSLVTSGSTWIMGADRTLAVSAYDGSGPRVLGTFSARFGTPLYVNLLSGVVSSLIMVLAFHFSGGNNNKYFSAVLSLAISTTTIAYLAVFPTLIRLRQTHPHVPRPYRVPFGNVGAWICSILTTFWALLATVALVWPGFGIGWFGTGGSADDSLVSLGFANQRFEFETTQILPLILLVILGIIFYMLGQATRAHVVEVPLSEVAEPAPAPI